MLSEPLLGETDASSSKADRPPPLDDVRVLDLSRVLAGPWCSQSLADLGAEVLKIESPGDGDETRTWGPPYAGEVSAYFACANRSKASLVIDLKTAEGQDKIRALAAEADILIENFKTGTLERLGLGYDELRINNPGLIFCSISGYGRTGAQAGRPGYDFVIQAESGLMSITGEPDGSPMKAGVAVSDIITGLYASQAILAALVDQRRTGLGRSIDVALFDCQLAALANVQSSALTTGATPERFGNSHPTVGPYQLYDAADGPFAVAIGNNRQFEKLCRSVLERPDLAEDPRFATNDNRLAHRAALNKILESFFRERPKNVWLGLFQKNELPAGLLQTVDQALQSDQTADRELVHRFSDELGIVKYPVRIEGGLRVPTPPPLHGQGGVDVAQSWLDSTRRQTTDQGHSR